MNARLTKLDQNNQRLIEFRNEGREWCWIQELPHPSIAKQSIDNGPILQILGKVVLINDVL